MNVYFFSFDLVLSLVAVPGGFERDCRFIAARFLPPWAEIVDPSPVFEKRGGRVGDLSPWLDPRPPDLGALAGKAEILDRSPPPLPFGTRVPDCSLAGELVAAFFAGRGLLVSSSKSKVKVIAHSHTLGITSYRLISLSFHVDRPFSTWDTAI